MIAFLSPWHLLGVVVVPVRLPSSLILVLVLALQTVSGCLPVSGLPSCRWSVVMIAPPCSKSVHCFQGVQSE